jgi:hypothetical protein
VPPPSEPVMMVLPSASVSGKSFRAVLRLMTITRGESAAS